MKICIYKVLDLDLDLVLDLDLDLDNKSLSCAHVQNLIEQWYLLSSIFTVKYDGLLIEIMMYS